MTRGSGSRSNRTVARSTPAMPSISAWWAFVSSAEAAVVEALDQPHLPQRLGAVELLGEDARARGSSAARRLPGCGSAVWRTWYSRLKSVSSIHSGRPVLARREGELLAVARHEVQAPADRVEEVVVCRRRAVERRRARRRACASPAPPGAGTTRRSPSACRGVRGHRREPSGRPRPYPAASVTDKAPPAGDHAVALLLVALLLLWAGGRRSRCPARDRRRRRRRPPPAAPTGGAPGAARRRVRGRARGRARPGPDGRPLRRRGARSRCCAPRCCAGLAARRARRPRGASPSGCAPCCPAAASRRSPAGCATSSARCPGSGTAIVVGAHYDTEAPARVRRRQRRRGRHRRGGRAGARPARLRRAGARARDAASCSSTARRAPDDSKAVLLRRLRGSRAYAAHAIATCAPWSCSTSSPTSRLSLPARGRLGPRPCGQRLRKAARRVGAGSAFPDHVRRARSSTTTRRSPRRRAGDRPHRLHLPVLAPRCDDMSAVSAASLDLAGEAVFELVSTWR